MTDSLPRQPLKKLPLPGGRSLPPKNPLSTFDWGEETSRKTVDPSLVLEEVEDDEDELELEIPETGWNTPNQHSTAPVFPPRAGSVDIETINEQSIALEIDDLLHILLDQGGSDLHLSAKAHPSIRVHGDIKRLEEYAVLSGEQIGQAIYSIMTNEQQKKFENDLELDFAYELAGRSRFRVNVFKQQTEVGVVMRAIPWEIKPIEALDLPAKLNDFAGLARGLVLVTGPTGSGKSTTLAAIIDKANRTRSDHIMTIEDPVEFVHEHQKCIINQREVGVDTKSFADALKRVLRQDPDIILVGEMRDLETISIALTAAETGHLVFGTLHTQSAKETITRIVDVFPEGAKAQVRTQLASTLQAVVCQTLLKKRSGGRIAALEIMLASPAIRSQIRENKLHQIESTIQTSAAEGMQTLDSVLMEYIKDGKVEFQDAFEKAQNPKQLLEELGGPEGIKRIERTNNQNSGIRY